MPGIKHPPTMPLYQPDQDLPDEHDAGSQRLAPKLIPTMTKQDIQRSLGPDKLKEAMEISEQKFGFSSNDFEKLMAEEQQKARKLLGLDKQIQERRERKIRRRREEQKRDSAEQAEPSGAFDINHPHLISQSAASPGGQNAEDKNYPVPGWYSKIDPKGRKIRGLMKTKDQPIRQAITALSSMKDCIGRCENEANPNQLGKFFDELRDHVHKAEFLPGIDGHVLYKVHMLDNGLKRIFAPTTTNVKFPWDLQADAVQLWHKWCVKNFSVNLLRGIKLAKAKDSSRAADRIEDSWKNKYSAKYHGQGDLVLGQWWPTQLCTVRDGAHGSAQGGIFGEKGKGAYSIVLSGGNHYGDVDEGEEILYRGTDSADSTPTDNTTHMIQSCDDIHEPVRVIRSWNLGKKNPYRPMRGFRYDGLYDVVGYKILDSTKAIYQFRLVRCKGQYPIRYQDKPSRRPSKWEIEEYDKLVDRRGVELEPTNKLV